MKRINEVIEAFETRFNVPRELLFQKWLPTEYRIYKYAFIKILKYQGISQNQIGALVYGGKKYTTKTGRSTRNTQACVPECLQRYEELIKIPGNKSIMEFVESYHIGEKTQ